VTSVAPSAPLPPMAANGSMPNNEPHRIKTPAVKGRCGRERCAGGWRLRGPRRNQSVRPVHVSSQKSEADAQAS
jgi:hypothetical protein